VALLIPAMDLMGGKVVQLEQGKKKVLEYEELEPWVERFKSYPLVHLIDLDAAMQNGNNSVIVERIVKELPCQVGGGVRSVERAKQLLDYGAKAVIFGSALLREGTGNVALAEAACDAIGKRNLVFAVDARHGKIAIDGWRSTTAMTPIALVQQLEPWCDAFLYTRVEGEGLMGGMPLATVKELRAATARRLFVAGGIRSDQEVADLHALGVDAVVGMALYRGSVGSSGNTQLPTV
jgi:phosphoribosylformimino-5-aminoimidazole carboxamide ribotide isomerase